MLLNGGKAERGTLEFITIKELYEMLPIGKNQASNLFRDIETKFKEDGYKQFITRPRCLPKKYVMEYLRKERLI